MPETLKAALILKGLVQPKPEHIVATAVRHVTTRANVFATEPISIRHAQEEKQVVLAEIREIQNWLSGRDLQSPDGGKVSSVNYHRTREEKIARLENRQKRSAFLKTWIANWNRENTANTTENKAVKLHVHQKLLVRMFHAVCELQEKGIEVGEAIEAILSDIEMDCPPRMLAKDQPDASI